MVNNLKGNDMFVLGNYESNTTEESLFKGIPIDYLDFVKNCLAKSSSITGVKYRIRYRGPRYDAFASNCLKKDAKTFAIYRK